MSSEFSNDPKSNNCAVCQVAANLSCSACRTVKYCGTDHQRQHWKTHKSDCRPFKIANDSQLGRHLLATRDIKADNVIFTETPLIVGPKWYLNEREEYSPVMPCVGCYTPCRMGVNKCPRCSWPACSPDCPGLQIPKLHGIECSILMLGSGPSSESDMHSLMDYYRSDALVVLKCLLLQRSNPKKWTQLMDMQSHAEERTGSELHTEVEERIVAYLQNNFLKRLKSIEQKTNEKYLPENDKNVLHRICGIIETNYMCISLPTGIELSGVFYTACMMEHNCQPNCYFQFDHRNDFKISIIAGRNINKGEHLKIMYSNMLWGTQMRHEHLILTKHFQCKCDRCCDPTEFGTYFSGLICMGDVRKECGGIQLPKDPLSETTDWVCNKCPMIVGGKEVRYLLTQMYDEVEGLLAVKPTIRDLEALIEKLSKFLHPNHAYLFALKHSLIQLYGTESGYTIDRISDALRERKMQMCEELLMICNKLDPYTIRLSIYVGIILYEMQVVLVERGHRLLSKKDKSDEDAAKAIDYYKKSHDHLKNAAKILEKEADNVAGRKLRETVLNALNGLEYRIANH